jgi:hypothetical protein
MPETPNTSSKRPSIPAPVVRRPAPPPPPANRLPRPPAVQPVILIHNSGSKPPWILILLLLAIGSAAAYYFLNYKGQTPTTMPTPSVNKGETSPPLSGTKNATEIRTPPATPRRGKTPSSSDMENATVFGIPTDEKSTHANEDKENFSKTDKIQTASDSVFIGSLWEGDSSFFFARDGTAWEWSHGSDQAWFGEWKKIDEETIYCSIGGNHVFKISPDKNRIRRYNDEGSEFQPPRTRRSLSPSPDIRDIQWDYKPGWKLVLEPNGALIQEELSSGQTYYYNGQWIDLGGGYFGKKTPENRDNNIYKVSRDNKTIEQRFPGGSRIWRRNGPVPDVIKLMPSPDAKTHPLAGTKWAYGSTGTYAIEFFPDGTMCYHVKNKTTPSQWFVADEGTVKTAQGASLFSISADGQLLSQIKEDKVTAWRRANASNTLPPKPSITGPNTHPLNSHFIADTKWTAGMNKNATLYFRADGTLLFRENLRKNMGKWSIVNSGTIKDEKETVFYLSLNKKFLTQTTGAGAFLWRRHAETGAPTAMQSSSANNNIGIYEEYEALEQAYAAFFFEKIKLINQRDNKSLESLKKSIGEKDIRFLKKVGKAMDAVAQSGFIESTPEMKPGKTLTYFETRLWNIKMDRERAISNLAQERGFQFKQLYEKLLKRAFKENDLELVIKLKRRVNYISLPPNPFGGMWQLSSPNHTWVFHFEGRDPLSTQDGEDMPVMAISQNGKWHHWAKWRPFHDDEGNIRIVHNFDSDQWRTIWRNNLYLSFDGRKIIFRGENRELVKK